MSFILLKRFFFFYYHAFPYLVILFQHSLVENNTLTDATDGAIVIFGAPYTIVHNNTIRALTRTLLGAINMVDFAPYSGNFTGVVWLLSADLE